MNKTDKRTHTKIAVAALGKTETSAVSERAGRAPYYLIFEEGKKGEEKKQEEKKQEGPKLIEVWKNPFASGGGGAGWSVAKVLAEKEVTLVLAGKFGQNMEAGLAERGIKYALVKGNVSEALQTARNNP